MSDVKYLQLLFSSKKRTILSRTVPNRFWSLCCLLAQNVAGLRFLHMVKNIVKTRHIFNI